MAQTLLAIYGPNLDMDEICTHFHPVVSLLFGEIAVSNDTTVMDYCDHALTSLVTTYVGLSRS
jgi:hypothetical protein